MRRHTDAFGNDPVLLTALEVGGEYAYRMRGEAHLWSPDAVAKLQHAVRTSNPDTFTEYTSMLDSKSAQAKTIRGLFDIRFAEERGLAGFHR